MPQAQSRFDALAKDVATETWSRRTALGVVIGTLAALMPVRALAKKGCDTNSECPANMICFNGQCQCPSGTVACSGSCVNPSSDNQNCGTCGTVCPAGSVCVSGHCLCLATPTGGACTTGPVTCEPTCPPGFATCNGVCTDTQTNPANCGACGNVCFGLCAGGACTCAPGSFTCTSGSTTFCCPGGTFCVQGLCSALPACPVPEGECGTANHHCLCRLKKSGGFICQEPTSGANCSTDADCPSGQLCAAAGTATGGVCVPPCTSVGCVCVA